MRHPLEHIPHHSRKAVFVLFLALTLATMLVMNAAGSWLDTEAAPYGILSFEFAGSPQRAGTILDSWNQPAQLRAAFIQGLDFLFLSLYSTTIALACLWAGETLHQANWSLAKLGAPLAWGLWLAALGDAVENAALMVMLFGSVTSPWAEIAAICATIKFALIFLGLVYVLYALVIRLATVLQSPATNTP